MANGALFTPGLVSPRNRFTLFSFRLDVIGYYSKLEYDEFLELKVLYICILPAVSSRFLIE